MIVTGDWLRVMVQLVEAGGGLKEGLGLAGGAGGLLSTPRSLHPQPLDHHGPQRARQCHGRLHCSVRLVPQPCPALFTVPLVAVGVLRELPASQPAPVPPRPAPCRPEPQPSHDITSPATLGSCEAWQGIMSG
ncbi:hypothetical protein O3P69_009342 [Scylla paramamosain]|uniref:Uncharacterized protein n=1 Tax=Scylla paramamosain TaxID=85552 RepID=A0AAW0TCS4_SCYPA